MMMMMMIPSKQVDIGAVSDCPGTTTKSAIVLVRASFPARQRIRQRYTIDRHPAPVAVTDKCPDNHLSVAEKPRLHL